MKKNRKRAERKKRVTYRSCLQNQQELCWGEYLKGH